MDTSSVTYLTDLTFKKHKNGSERNITLTNNGKIAACG